jgi:hypothetical protein
MSQSTHYQILRTYWRRPLVLLLAFLFLICFANLAFMPKSNRYSDLYPRPEPVGNLHFVFSSADELRSEREISDRTSTLDELLAETDAKSIRSLTVSQMRPDDPLPNVLNVPHLQYLKLSGIDLTEESVQQILRLPKLNALELTSEKMPAGTLARIGQQVSELQIRSGSLEQYRDELPKMSAVRLLTVEYDTPPQGLIKDIAKIPHLEQLSFVPRGHQQGSHNALVLTPEMQTTLRTHPTLKTVYANWGIFPQQNQYEQQTLLPVRSFPLQYPAENQTSVGMTVFEMCILGALIIVQLWAQFLVPAAAVVPHYLRPHRRVAIGVLCLGMLLAWLALLRYQLDLLASASIVIASAGVLSLYVMMFMIENRFLKTWVIPIIVIACFVTPAFTILRFSGFSSEFIWYMHGYMPRLAATISLFSIGAVVYGFRKLSVVTNHVNEKFSSLPIFSPWDTTKANKYEGQQYNNWLVRLLDSGYQQLEYRSRTTVQMVSLWRKGNLFRPTYVLFFMVLVILFSVVPRILMGLATGEQILSGSLKEMGGVIAGPVGMGFILPVIGWWQRSRYMESESLKPVSRSSLRNQLYFALAFDHWLLWIGMFGFLVHRALDAPGGWLEMGGLLLLFGVAAPLWIIGSSSCVLIFKRAWVVLASMIGLYLLVAIGLGLAVALATSAVPGSVYDMQILYLLAGIAVFCAVVLNLITYRALLHREWG